jgi:hypothetical protein
VWKVIGSSPDWKCGGKRTIITNTTRSSPFLKRKYTSQYHEVVLIYIKAEKLSPASKFSRNIPGLRRSGGKTARSRQSEHNPGHENL